MKADTLHQIIKDKNDQRERQVLHTAEEIIEQIVAQQRAIASATEKIAALREELKQLEVQTLDPATVLG